MGHSHVDIALSTRQSIAGFHHALHWASACADRFARHGSRLLSLDLVPQGGASAIVDSFFCCDDEYFGIGDFTDIDCSIFAVDERVSTVGKQLRFMPPNKSPEPTADGAGSSAIASVKPRGATPLYGVHVTSRRWLSFFR
jgi:hypothetical protein